jgi:hypothetical protein
VTLVPLVFPEDNITFVLNESAVLPGAPQSERNRSAIKVVVLAKNLLDVASGLLGVIVRHSGEEMVSDVGVGNVMMQMVNEETEITINGQSSSTLEVPNTLTVMGKSGVSVLKIGDQNEPEVDEQVRNEVVLENSDGSKSVCSKANGGQGRNDTDIRNNDIPNLVILVNSTPRVVVRSPTRVLLSRHIDEQIQRPSESKHEHHHDEDVERSFFENVVWAIALGIVFALRQAKVGSCVWNKHLFFAIRK